MHLAGAFIQRNLQKRNKSNVPMSQLYSQHTMAYLLSQVTFTIENVSKQRHNNKQESSRINDANFIKYETKSNSA